MTAAASSARGGIGGAWTGLGLMIGLVVRRNAVRLAVWFGLVVGMTIITAAFYTDQFDASGLAERAVLSSSPGMRTVFGAVSSVGVGAAVWSEMWMFTAVALGVGMALLVTRDNRADEEQGRAELLYSRPVSAGAGLAASVMTATAVTVAAGFGAALVAAAFGLDPAGTGLRGSWIMGASLGGVGLVGIGVAALTNQLATTGRGANALALGVLALCYLLRGVGDLKGAALTWVSPIGWGEKMDPWGANRWWPLALTIALFAACVIAARLVRARRDYGAGLARPRPGPARAGVASTTELGLVARVGRGAAVAWTVGIAGWAVLLGSTLTDMSDLADQLAVLTGGGGIDSMIALWMRITALIVAGLVVRELLTLRADEERGLMEARLAGSISRLRLVTVRLAFTGVLAVLLMAIAGAIMGAIYGAAVADPTWTGRLTAAALGQLPSLAVMTGLTLLCAGWLPRVSVELAWAFLGLAWIVGAFGTALGISADVLARLPFTGSDLPATTPNWITTAATTLAAVVLIVAGLAGYRRRDIPR